MSLREKIVVVLAALAVIYGAYELGLKNLFTGDPAAEKGAARQDRQGDAESDIASFTAGVIKKSESVQLTPRETQILDHRETEWPQDPFIDATTALAMKAAEAGEADGKKKRTAEQKRFTYSGYIALGNMKLAVINGMEYEEGETLKETEYVVRRIRPSSVVLADGQRHITVHLDEIEAKVE
ncbi:MAG: hypothetical protein SWH68_00260 [Thermodesulfobacteriota bacterium]|nr:hypothetical protein [Thermodesulfobacteriota bacterium]